MLVIGDRINGTIQSVRKAIVERDGGFIAGLASAQARSGADCIDVNVGIGEGESEHESMRWALEVVRSAVDTPVSLDSSDPAVLESGLRLVGSEGTFLNSVSGEADRMAAVLPLAAGSGCRLVALAMDEGGIPASAPGRVDVCRKILGEARAHGIPDSSVYFDPLVLPVSVDCLQGRITLEAIALIRREFPEAKTVLGLSNVSFGLPRRTLLNQAMLADALFLGLDAALLDPTDSELLSTVYAAEAIAGEDAYCRRYIKAFRAGMLGNEPEGPRE